MYFQSFIGKVGGGEGGDRPWLASSYPLAPKETTSVSNPYSLSPDPYPRCLKNPNSGILENPDPGFAMT